MQLAPRTRRYMAARRRLHGLRYVGVGLLTVDVTALGVVMSSDSQPIEIGSGDIRVLDFGGERRRDKIIERHGGGFDGLIGYVGTEHVGIKTTRAFIECVSHDAPDLPLARFAEHLARELSAAELCHLFVAGGEVEPVAESTTGPLVGLECDAIEPAAEEGDVDHGGLGLAHR
jgi:hypothetical protein